MKYSVIISIITFFSLGSFSFEVEQKDFSEIFICSACDFFNSFYTHSLVENEGDNELINNESNMEILTDDMIVEILNWCEKKDIASFSQISSSFYCFIINNYHSKECPNIDWQWQGLEFADANKLRIFNWVLFCLLKNFIE